MTPYNLLQRLYVEQRRVVDSMVKTYDSPVDILTLTFVSLFFGFLLN